MRMKESTIATNASRVRTSECNVGAEIECALTLDVGGTCSMLDSSRWDAAGGVGVVR